MIRRIVVAALTVAMIVASTALGLAVALRFDAAGDPGLGVFAGVGLGSALCWAGSLLLLRGSDGWSRRLLVGSVEAVAILCGLGLGCSVTYALVVGGYPLLGFVGGFFAAFGLAAPVVLWVRRWH